ncbi:MAG: OadG family protein [Lachnospiraceae bacterium]|nr:OadG family protein [Lachnospiraceae bacterium]
MKKIITLVCTIACVFGLTACESEPTYTQYEQQKMKDAMELAVNDVVPYFQNYMSDDKMADFDGYTAEEIAFSFTEETGLVSDGYTIKGIATSFNNAAENVGTIEKIKTEEIETEIKDKTIIVRVPVQGSIKDGKAEIIFSNDRFKVIQSAALNEEATLGDAMVKAALNTIIGMGTVFIVLILISFIIALFGYIPKIQAKIEEGKKKKEQKDESIDNTIAQIVEKEEVDVTDDYELVAVIAAAIAASEGAASTDGFVVRSVRKVNRRR